jgi:hypothetical protein
MSSGGANTTTARGATLASNGYPYSLVEVRNSGDWIALKRQVRIRNDAKSAQSSPPWISYGSNYRLDYLNGGYKQGEIPGCTACNGNAFG